jgi:hypothetical protein
MGKSRSKGNKTSYNKENKRGKSTAREEEENENER